MSLLARLGRRQDCGERNLGDTMTKKLIEAPGAGSRTFLNFPLVENLDDLSADFAILGIPFGLPYYADKFPNDQSRAPDAIRAAPNAEDIAYTLNHFDFDLDGYLLDGQDITVVDCGNVVADPTDHMEHYRCAEKAARNIFSSGAILIALGGDHGIHGALGGDLKAVVVAQRALTPTRFPDRH